MADNFRIAYEMLAQRVSEHNLDGPLASQLASWVERGVPPTLVKVNADLRPEHYEYLAASAVHTTLTAHVTGTLSPLQTRRLNALGEFVAAWKKYFQ